jgi:hypothetical protein
MSFREAWRATRRSDAYALEDFDINAFRRQFLNLMILR